MEMLPKKAKEAKREQWGQCEGTAKSGPLSTCECDGDHDGRQAKACHSAASGTSCYTAAGSELRRLAYAVTGCRCLTPAISDAVNIAAQAVPVNQKQDFKEKKMCLWVRSKGSKQEC